MIILSLINFFQLSLRLDELNVQCDSDDRYVSLNVSHKKIGKETFFNTTFFYHEKVQTERLYFVIYVPWNLNDANSEHKVIETSIDNCRAAFVVKANFVVRAFLQNIIDCGEDPLTCPKSGLLRFTNCPGIF